MLLKNFDISLFKKISVFSFKGAAGTSLDKYLFFELKENNYHFIKLPDFIRIEKNKDNLSLKNMGSEAFNTKFKDFLNLFEDAILNSSTRHKLSLFLKGAGFTATVSACKKYLNLNIGFSNTSVVSIPTEKLDVFCDKNVITVSGRNSVFVGDFISKIRSLKIPDAYKGKGFWLCNEIRPKKEIKKS